MGLDNGIIYKNIQHKCAVGPFIRWAAESIETNEIELCYWRKCWNIRREILAILNAPQDGGEFSINLFQLRQIRKTILRFLLHPKEWDCNSELNSSIWTYSEIKWRLVRSCVALLWAERRICKDPGSYVIFYDSY